MRRPTFNEVGQGAFHIAEAAADTGQCYAFFDTLSGVLHKLIKLLFRRLESGRQHFGLAKALRLSLLRERAGPRPGTPENRRKTQQVELVSVGEDIDRGDRSVQRQIIVHNTRELRAYFALQQKRRRSCRHKQ